MNIEKKHSHGSYLLWPVLNRVSIRIVIPLRPPRGTGCIIPISRGWGGFSTGGFDTGGLGFPFKFLRGELTALIVVEAAMT
jgi:hypothetical protein